MKKFWIVILMFLFALMLCGCSCNKTIVSESKYSEAMSFSAKNNYQITFRNSDNIQISFVVDGDRFIYKSYYNNIFFSYNKGHIIGASNLPFGNSVYIDQSEEFSDEIEDILGVTEDFSVYTWKEIFQDIFWEFIGDYTGKSEITFLKSEDLRSLLMKIGKYNDSYTTQELNEKYRKYLSNSIFLKEYNMLEYDESEKAYKYSDENCDIYYYFKKNKIVKIQYKNVENDCFEFDISYNKETIQQPTIYKFDDSSYSSIKVSLGGRRNLSQDFGKYNVDISKGSFIMSDPDFATINNKTNTLIVNDLTMKDYFYLGYIVDNQIYIIRYYL